MAVAPREQILEMLVEAESERIHFRDKGQFYLYGEAGLLVWKRVYGGTGPYLINSVPREIEPLPGAIGYTKGGSNIELQVILDAVDSDINIEPFSVNNGESQVVIGNRFYFYNYRPNAWHQPVISGNFIGNSRLLHGTGLYFHNKWLPGELPRAYPNYPPWFDPIHYKMIWGYVPLEEILGMVSTELIAQKTFILGQLNPDGSPSDKQSQHYVELSRFLAALKEKY